MDSLIGTALGQYQIIYSLGIVAYEMLTGRVPFHGDMAVVTLHQQIYNAPPLLRRLNPRLSPAMERVALKALAKQPQWRHTSAGELAREFSATVQITQPETIVARRTLVRSGRSMQSVFALSGALGVLFILLFAVLLSIYTPGAPAVAALPKGTRTATSADALSNVTSPTLLQSPLATSTTAIAAPHATATSGSMITEERIPTATNIPPTQTRLLRTTTPTASPRMITIDDGANPLWVDIFEVTNEQFEQFSVATGYRTLAEKRGWSDITKGGPTELSPVTGASWRQPKGPGSVMLPRQPVVQVSKEDAVSYCRWANKRLPSANEWTTAARFFLKLPEYVYEWISDQQSFYMKTKDWVGSASVLPWYYWKSVQYTQATDYIGFRCVASSN